MHCTHDCFVTFIWGWVCVQVVSGSSAAVDGGWMGGGALRCWKAAEASELCAFPESDEVADDALPVPGPCLAILPCRSAPEAITRHVEADH